MAFSSQDNLSASFTKDSDELQEMFCEHCEKHENKYAPAEGFCVDCVEYMCDTCLKYHTRYVKGHCIKDKYRMPQDFCLQKCSTHADQLIKFYCNDCNMIACTECKANNHQNCGSVCHLPALVKGIENSEELKDLIKNMDKLAEDIEHTERQVNQNIQKVEEQEAMTITGMKGNKDRLMETYKKHQQEIIDKFDKDIEETIARLKKERQSLVADLAEKQNKFETKICNNEKEVTEKIVQVKKADEKLLQSTKAANTTLKQNLTVLSSNLVQKQKMGQRCQLFIAIKEMEGSVEKMDTNVSSMKERNDIHYYTTESNVTAPDGNSLETADTFFSYKELPSSRMKRKASHYFDLPTQRCQFKCLCLLNESTLLVSDVFADTILIYRNLNEASSYDSIKMTSYPRAITKVDNNKAAVTFPSKRTVRLTIRPFAITKVDNNKAAVTFPDEGTVRLITFSDSTTVIETEDITVGYQCTGIAYSNNNFIVSYDTQPGQIQILDMSGNILNTFDKDSNGKSLFTRPWYMAVSPDNTTIYVSDWDRNTVTSLTFDGKVKAIYEDDQLQRPYQLTVDESGAVYVCCSASCNVHQLSSDLTKVKILLDGSHRTVNPMNIAYCQSNSRLYVGMRNSDIIKVFNLSLQ